MVRRALITALLASGLLAVPVAASANTESATVGNVTAELSYTPTGIGFANTRMKIIRGGSTLIDQAAPASPSCPECPPGPAFGGRGNSVHIVQLDSSPEPEVVFDLYTGGAHCCFYSQIFAFNGAGYSGPVHDFGDPGYSFIDPEKDGRFEFRSGDLRFAYAFGSFAATRFPPQIWRFDGTKMVDVTRTYPALIRADVKRLKRQFNKFKSLGIKPLLAAYVADQLMLGRFDRGLALVAKAKKKGYLANSHKFLRRLERFLIRTGYEVPPND